MPTVKHVTSLTLAVVFGAFLTGCGLFGLDGDSDRNRYVVPLSGDNEVPQAVETEASGEATFTINRSQQEIEYKLTVSDLESATQAHIHLGSPDENGPAVAFLLKLTENVDGTGAGSPRSFEEEQVVGLGTIMEEDVLAVPAQSFEGRFEDLAGAISRGEAYVNVHTTDYPGGVLRGHFDEETLVDERRLQP